MMHMRVLTRLSLTVFCVLAATACPADPPPAGTDTVYSTQLTDHQPPLATATYDAVTGNLTVTVDASEPPASGDHPLAARRRSVRRVGPGPKDFARLDFYGRNGQVFDTPRNDLFDSLRGKPHAQENFVRGKATFRLHLAKNAIQEQTRLVVVISYTQGRDILGPGFTTVILTPPGARPRPENPK